MKRKWILCLCCLVAAVLLFAACGKTTPPERGDEPSPDPGKTPAEAAFYVGDTLFETLHASEAGELTLPTPPRTAGSAFLCWAKESEGGEVACLAGDTVGGLKDGETLVFRAVSVKLSTASGARPAAGGEEAFSFEGRLAGEDYRRLASLVGEENIEVGMLVAPYGAVTGGDRTFTPDCGAAGLSVQPTALAASDAATYTFFGKTAEIPQSELLEKYAGRAYLTCRVGDGVVTVYADYEPLLHTASLYGASAAAYEDLTDAPDATHTERVETPKGERYAPYDEAERALLRARLDRVVNVDTAARRVINAFSLNNVDFYNFLYYESPYALARVLENAEEGTTTFVVVGAEGQDFNVLDAYYIGGSYRPPKKEEWQADGLYITVSNRAG